MNIRMRIGAALALAFMGGSALAADYPNKLIKIVVPAAAGSVLDPIGRAYVDEIHKQWGQTAILEHRPGANSMIGAGIVSKAAPDGYTLLLTTVNHVINGGVHASIAFDPVKDFSAVAIICKAPLVLVANANSPIRTISDLIALGKSGKGTINYSSPGIGSINHLAMEAIKTTAGIDVTHIPYGGSPQATNAVVAGEVPVYFSNLLGATPQMKAGRIHAVAVTTRERSPALPDVPSVSESINGYDLTSWYGMMAPTGVPKEILDKLNRLFNDVGKQPEFQQRLLSVGVVPASMTASEFSTFVAEEGVKWKKIAADAKAKVE